jgi:hypothetical protein
MILVEALSREPLAQDLEHRRREHGGTKHGALQGQVMRWDRVGEHRPIALRRPWARTRHQDGRSAKSSPRSRSRQLISVTTPASRSHSSTGCPAQSTMPGRPKPPRQSRPFQRPNACGASLAGLVGMTSPCLGRRPLPRCAHARLVCAGSRSVSREVTFCRDGTETRDDTAHDDRSDGVLDSPSTCLS